MSSAGRQAPGPPPQDGKEIDSVKESISDIINQLQDIDPARLSFSPFLDLDTQISLAPVSDSPESSVEELHSPSSPPHSVTGSQHSLDAPPPPVAPPHQAAAAAAGTNLHRGCEPCPPQQQQPSVRPSEEPGSDRGKEEEALDDGTPPGAVIPSSLEGAAENCISSGSTPDRSLNPRPAPDAVIPNGTDAAERWSPGSTKALYSTTTTADEGHPLIGGPAESVELTVWDPDMMQEGMGTCEEDAVEAAESQRPPACRCCRGCPCCGRLAALCSVLASLLCSAGILYAFYFYVPIRTPDLPDLSRRLVFTLCCCAVAALPILLAMLAGAVSQFCSASLDPVAEPFPRRRALHRLFVTASLELFVLYALNLLVLGALLPQELRLVPMLATLFVLGRFVYWFLLHACSSWRGFGSGLTLFPLLAMVALNLYLMVQLAWGQPLFSGGTQDIVYNQQATPSAWPLTTVSQRSPLAGKWDNVLLLPTDILDTQ